MSAPLSREFELVCACCRWPRDAYSSDLVQSLVADADMLRVVEVTKRHRVGGLVAGALKNAGVRMPPALTATSGRLARTNLLMIKHAVSLRDALNDAGIQVVFLKGLPLSIQAYGTTSFKMSLDIDILVDLACIDKACTILAELGYIRKTPDASIPPQGITIWVEYLKETSWVHPVNGVMIDLHARTSEVAKLEAASLRSNRVMVEVSPGESLPALAIDSLFIYLSVHGAEHGWSRLKWLADFAAVARALGPAEVERLYRHAAEQGLERCVAQGLLLSARLLGLPLGSLRAVLEKRRVHRVLVWVALRTVAGKHEAAEHQRHLLGGVPILVTASQLLLRRGLAYKLDRLRAWLANPRDRALRRLPPSLSLLYPLLGVARLGRRALTPTRLGGVR